MNMAKPRLAGEPALPPRPALDEIDEEGIYALRIRVHFARERPWLLVVGEEREVGHALRIEHAVQVIALVLQQSGPRAERIVLDRLALERLIADMDVQIARHLAMQAGNGEAALPDLGLLLRFRRDDRIHHHGPRPRLEAGARRDA